MEEIERLNDKYEKHSEKISHLQVDAAAIKTQVDQIKSAIAAAESRLQNITATYGAYKRELEIVQENIKDIASKVDNVENTTINEISSLKVDISLLKDKATHTVKLWWVIVSAFLSSTIGIVLSRYLV